MISQTAAHAPRGFGHGGATRRRLVPVLCRTAPQRRAWLPPPAQLRGLGPEEHQRRSGEGPVQTRSYQGDFFRAKGAMLSGFGGSRARLRARGGQPRVAQAKRHGQRPYGYDRCRWSLKGAEALFLVRQPRLVSDACVAPVNKKPEVLTPRPPDEEDRTAILRRRAMFIASAVAGLGMITNSSCDPRPCLEPYIPTPPETTSYPGPCLSVPYEPPDAGSTSADAGSTIGDDGGIARNADPKDPVDGGVAADPNDAGDSGKVDDEGGKGPVLVKPHPSPCLSVKPPRK